MTDRTLYFEGCFNARDLGGFATAAGCTTQRRVLVRSDAPNHLTDKGWADLYKFGVRTVIDLTNHGEMTPDTTARPSDIVTIRIALDGGQDSEFWAKWSGPRFCTPVYYKPHLERFPELSASVLRAIASAQPGAVLFHCGGGRDRTGLIAMLLLSIAGVSPEHIAEDHSISYPNISRRNVTLGGFDDLPAINEFLAEEKTTTQELICRTLSTVSILESLERGGLAESDVGALRSRLLG